MTSVQCVAHLWKSLLQMMDADCVHGFRKYLYEFIKQMFMPVRHKPLPEKMPECSSVAEMVF